MHRKDVIRKLQRYTPSNPEEQLYKNKMIHFIKEHENCFERSLKKGHLTSSAWLLNKSKTKALLLHHTKLNMWLQLGGHCDGNSDILGVAIKEAQEESGIQNIAILNKNIFDIDIHLIPANNKDKEHYHYDIRFLLHVTSDETVKQNRESKALRWIEKSSGKLPTSDPSIVRMFDKWLLLN